MPLDDDTKVVFNITDIIGHGKYVSKTSKRNGSNCIWLDREWNLNNEDFHAKVITPYFIGTASKAGMKITSGWDNKYNFIVFRCLWHRANNPQQRNEQHLKNRPKLSLKNPNLNPKPRYARIQHPPKLNQNERLNLSEADASTADKITCKFRFVSTGTMLV